MSSYKDKAIEITREDLPGLYYSASGASQDAQSAFLRLNVVNIVVLIALGFLSAINVGAVTEKYRYIIPLLSSILLTASIILTFATDFMKYEKKWYDGRAVAESIKSLSWKFMMKADPFHNLSKQDAEERFITEFKEIKTAIKPMGEIFGEYPHGNEHQLTDKMKQIYVSDLDVKKATYEMNRINGQKKWYKSNSGKNSFQANLFFLIIIGLEIFATVVAILMISSPEFAFNPTGLITTTVAGLMSWMQIKQYRNLAESYGVTSTELSLIEDTIPNIKDSSRFSSFVAQSETAISREHTLWRARRTVQ